MRTWIAYRRHLLGAMGLAAGCGVEPSDAETDALPADAAGPPALTLTQPGPLHTGVAVTFVVSGAAPGATVTLAGSATTGNGPCPPGLGVCLDITGPRVLGRATANNAGQASLDVTLPHALPDSLTLHFQAAASGTKSAVLTDTTSHPARTCGEHPWLTSMNYYQVQDAFACAPLPPGGACPAPGALSPQQVEWLFQHNTGIGQLWSGVQLEPYCWEDTVEDGCCYASNLLPGPIIGRPFGVHGAERLPAVCEDDGWAYDLDLALDGLRGGARRRVALAWTRHARGEHASIAAFARFILQLSHLGAPAELVAEATRAMADEIQHARDAFAVATAVTGAPVGAGPLDAAGSLDELDVAAIVRAAVREGCVGETIAAAQARVAADGCEAPALRAILARVADDESRHAALAWRFVRWAVQARPELAAVVADEVARGYAAQPAPHEPYADALRAWGQLPDADMASVGRQVFDQVVVPCAVALLGPGHGAVAVAV